MKTGEKNRNNKRTEIKRFHWFIERIQTHLAFGRLSERSDGKTLCPTNFLVIALTSHCNTIGQSNNAFSILGFFFGGKTKSPWARSIQPNFPEISVQNSMDRFGPTGKVSKKRVHLLRWSSFPGRTGWNFGWMDRAPCFVLFEPFFKDIRKSLYF